MFAADIVSVWKTAREAFDGPEPPEDWTEQKWAGLLFETTCQVRLAYITAASC